MPSLRRTRDSATLVSARTQFGATAREMWNETSGTLKRAWLVLWACGAALLAFGAWGDNSGFWNDKPYLSNTVSELTCTAFGVPVALIMLQRLASLETDAAESRSARRMARRVSADFETAAQALAKDGIAGMRAARECLRNLLESLVPNGDYWRSAAAPRLRYQPYVDAIEEAMKKVDELFGPELKPRLAEVAALWSILTTESRFRLLDTDNEWLPGFQAERLASLVRAVTAPALEEWRGKGLDLQSWYQREDQHSGATRYGELDTLRAFDRWFGDVINYIDAVTDLSDESALAARSLASPRTRD